MILPDPNLTIEDQPSVVILAMLVWGEARGESTQGKLAVAEVVKNRARRHSWWTVAGPRVGPDHSPQWEWDGVKRAALRKWQFSCFNPNDKNRDKLLRPTKWDSHDIWEECFRIAEFVHSIPIRKWNPLIGTARGADYYHRHDAPDAPWMKGAKANGGVPLISIGNHWFWELGPDGVPDTSDDLITS